MDLLKHNFIAGLWTGRGVFSFKHIIMFRNRWYHPCVNDNNIVKYLDQCNNHCNIYFNLSRIMPSWFFCDTTLVSRVHDLCRENFLISNTDRSTRHSIREIRIVNHHRVTRIIIYDVYVWAGTRLCDYPSRCDEKAVRQTITASITTYTLFLDIHHNDILCYIHCAHGINTRRRCENAFRLANLNRTRESSE